MTELIFKPLNSTEFLFNFTLGKQDPKIFEISQDTYKSTS